MPELYPIRAVVQMTGLSIDTLRAWERRHQAVVPDRSGDGRQYASAQVERLLLLKELVAQGHRIGAIAALPVRQLRALRVQPQLRPIAGSVNASTTGLLERTLGAIEGFDARALAQELNHLAAALSSREFVYGVVVPLLREVGERWCKGRLSMAQEHMVTQAVRNLLGSLIRLHSPTSGARRILLTTPSGDTHELGLLAAAMLAALSGFEPVCLGPNLPAHEIVDAARRSSVDVVLLGITYGTHVTAGQVRSIAAELPAKTHLWVGGPAAIDLDRGVVRRRPVLLKSLDEFEARCGWLLNEVQ
jgi:MerR family transcriptional regulator, light-induced transcriptional regulator